MSAAGLNASRSAVGTEFAVPAVSDRAQDDRAHRDHHDDAGQAERVVQCDRANDTQQREYAREALAGAASAGLRSIARASCPTTRAPYRATPAMKPTTLLPTPTAIRPTASACSRVTGSLGTDRTRCGACWLGCAPVSAPDDSASDSALGTALVCSSDVGEGMSSVTFVSTTTSVSSRRWCLIPVRHAEVRRYLSRDRRRVVRRRRTSVHCAAPRGGSDRRLRRSAAWSPPPC